MPGGPEETHRSQGGGRAVACGAIRARREDRRPDGGAAGQRGGDPEEIVGQVGRRSPHNTHADDFVASSKKRLTPAPPSPASGRGNFVSYGQKRWPSSIP